jgi:hypothetical protein
MTRDATSASPRLEIAIRGAAGVICVQWRQAIITGRVKRWSGRSRRAEARAGAERPASQEGGTVEAWSGLDEDSVRPLGKPGQHPDAMTTGPSVGQGRPSWLAGAWLQFAPTVNRFGLGQIFSLNGVGHHTRRRVRSVHGARVSGRVCGKHMWSRRSPGGTCCCGDARPALAYQRGPALRALGRHDCAQQLKERVHPVEQSNTGDAEQPVSMIHAA